MTKEKVVARKFTLCAKLSSEGRHSEALRLAHEAREIIQAELIQAAGLKLEARSDAPGARGLLRVPNKAANDKNKSTGKGVSQHNVAMLVISYHNIGWELSCLGRGDHAVQWYTKAVPIAEVHLGADSALSIRLRRLAGGEVLEAISAAEPEDELQQGEPDDSTPAAEGSTPAAEGSTPAVGEGDTTVTAEAEDTAATEPPPDATVSPSGEDSLDPTAVPDTALDATIKRLDSGPRPGTAPVEQLEGGWPRPGGQFDSALRPVTAPEGAQRARARTHYHTDMWGDLTPRSLHNARRNRKLCGGVVDAQFRSKTASSRIQPRGSVGRPSTPEESARLSKMVRKIARQPLPALRLNANVAARARNAPLAAGTAARLLSKQPQEPSSGDAEVATGLSKVDTEAPAPSRHHFNAVPQQRPKSVQELRARRRAQPHRTGACVSRKCNCKS